MARRLRIELDLDAKGFGATISDASGKITAFSGATDRAAAATERMERRMRGVLATARDLTLVLSQVRVAIYNLRVVMTGWIEKIIQANIEVERMTFLLAGMSDKLTFEGRMEEAAGQVDMLLQKAKQAPFTISAMTDSLVKMKAGGLDPLDGSLDALIDSVAAFGGDDQMLKRASIAIQQMGGKGVVSMEELRQQLGEAVPFAMQLMSRSMGLTMKEMVDAISEGSVEAESALNGMFGEFERTFGGSAARLMDTFTGRLNVARTSLTEFGLAVGGFENGQFGQGGFMDTLNTKLEEFIALLQTPEAAIFAQRLGEGLVGLIKGLESAVRVMAQFSNVIIAAGKAMLLYFSGRIVINSVMGIATAFGALTGRTGVLRTAFSDIAAVTSVMAGDFRRSAGAANILRTRAGILASGLGMLRGAFSALLGPIGIAITTIYFAAEALGFFKNKSKEAQQAIEDFQKGLVSDKSLELAREEQQRLADEIERTEIRLAAAEASRRAGQKRHVDAISAELERLRAEYAETTEMADKMAAALSLDKAEQAGTNVIKQLRAQTAELTRTYDETASGLQEILQAIVDNENLSEDERNAQRKAIREQQKQEMINFYNDQLAIATTMQNQINSELAALEKQEGGGNEQAEKIDRLKAESAALNVEMTRLRQSLRNQTEAFDTLTNLIGEYSGATGDASDKVDEFANKSSSMAVKLAGLQATLASTGGSAADMGKELAQLEAWMSTSGVKLTEEQANALRQMAVEIDNVSQEIKDLRNDQQAMNRLTTQFERATGYAEQMAAVLSKGMSETEAEAAAFDIRLQQIISKMTVTTEEAKKLAEQTKEAFLEGRTNNFLVGLRRQTEQIKIDLLDRDEAAEANFQRDVARINEYVNLQQLSGKKRIEAEKIVADYIAARRQQLEEETKGQMQRTMEQWAKTTENMEGAAVGWMDSFVDALVEGELSFGKFAKAILADIAKIIIRAQIANAIMSAFGGGGGGGFTFKQNGGNTIGKVAHTGGIMGVHSKGSRSLPSAIFGGAPRYHNGGIAGLRPNEVPAILERGERVLTEAEQRAMEGGGRTPTVEVNIVNQGGQQMQEESRSSRFDGEKWVVDIVTRHMSQPGKLRNTTKQLARS